MSGPINGDEPDSLRRTLFSFEGRVSRRVWWLWGVGAMLGLGLYFTVVLRVAGATPGVAEGVVNLLLVWPAVAISAKRWHDRGKPAWWLLVALIPVVGWLWVLIENGCLAGDRSANRFGPPPLE